MSNTNTTTEVATRTLSDTLLKQEEGRRRNNKKRRANGEKAVAPKAFYLGKLDSRDFAALRAGESVTKTYGSGRVESYVLG